MALITVGLPHIKIESEKNKKECKFIIENIVKENNHLRLYTYDYNPDFIIRDFYDIHCNHTIYEVFGDLTNLTKVLDQDTTHKVGSIIQWYKVMLNDIEIEYQRDGLATFVYDFAISNKYFEMTEDWNIFHKTSENKDC